MAANVIKFPGSKARPVRRRQSDSIAATPAYIQKLEREIQKLRMSIQIFRLALELLEAKRARLLKGEKDGD